MNTFTLNISSCDGTIFEEEIISIILRGASGDLAIMAGHIPFATSVVPCVLRIKKDDETELKANIKSGLLTVNDEKVTLITSSLEWIK